MSLRTDERRVAALSAFGSWLLQQLMIIEADIRWITVIAQQHAQLRSGACTIGLVVDSQSAKVVVAQRCAD